MRKRAMGRYAIAITSLLLMLMIGSAAAQFNPISDASPRFDASNTNAVTVTVRKADGSPLSDAHVQVSSIGTRTIIASGYTNSMGVAEIPNVANGVYEITAMKGVDQASDRIEVRNGDSQVALKLTGDA